MSELGAIAGQLWAAGVTDEVVFGGVAVLVISMIGVAFIGVFSRR